jgi:hypothetical protein
MRKNFFKKKLASTLALAMVVTSLAVPTSASAATTTKIVKQGGAAAPTVLYVGTKGTDYGLNKVVKGAKYTWTTSNSSIAKINKSGVVTAKAPGKVTIKVTARNSKGKWLNAYTKKVTINQRATSVDIAADDFKLLIGQEKDLNAVKTPAKSTDTVKYVSDNTAVATVNAKSGVVKAVGVGEATITVLSKATSSTADTSKYNKKDTVKVTVADGIQSVKQTTVNKLEVTTATDQHEKLTKDNIVITDANGVKQVVKEVSFSTDGKVATVSLYIDLTDKATYKVAYADTEKSFEASVGKVASIQISGQTVQYQTPSKLTVKLFDANGVDVTTNAELQNNVTFDCDYSKAYVDTFDDGYKITVYNFPSSVTVKAIYHTYDYTGGIDEKKFESSAVINSVEELAKTAADIKYTLSSTKPDWNKLVTTLPTDAKGYKLFIKAKDQDDKDVTEKDFDYVSSDESILVVSKSDDGVFVYPVKAGSAYIKVTYGKTVKMLPVTVGAEAKAATISVTSSNTTLYAAAGLVDDEAEFTVNVKDQYNNKMTSDDPVTIESTSSSATPLTFRAGTGDDNNVAYFKIADYTTVTKTGSYSFKLTYAGRTTNVTVKVAPVDTRRAEYNVETSVRFEQSANTVDVVVTDDTNASKKINFTAYGYNKYGERITKYDLTRATISVTKGNDTITGKASAVGNVVSFAALQVAGTADVATKAAVGGYVIKIDPDGSGSLRAFSASFTITNSQVAPIVKVDKQTSKNTTLRTIIEDTLKYGDNYNLSGVEAIVKGQTSKNLDASFSVGERVTIQKIKVKEQFANCVVEHEINVNTTITIVD